MAIVDFADFPIQARMYGGVENCIGCRFWSEMIARSVGGSPVEALCLAKDGPNSGQYVTGRVSCDAWKSGHYGPVDDPDDGPGICAAYAAEDAA